MIVRRHVVVVAEHPVSLTEVDNVVKDIQVHAADGCGEHALAFSRSETGKRTLDDIGWALVTDISYRIFMFALAFLSPYPEIIVDLGSHFLTSLDRDDPESACRKCVQMPLFVSFDRFHKSSSLS
jgi:hypothetical protein